MQVLTIRSAGILSQCGIWWSQNGISSNCTCIVTYIYLLSSPIKIKQGFKKYFYFTLKISFCFSFLLSSYSYLLFKFPSLHTSSSYNLLILTKTYVIFIPCTKNRIKRASRSRICKVCVNWIEIHTNKYELNVTN